MEKVTVHMPGSLRDEIQRMANEQRRGFGQMARILLQDSVSATKGGGARRIEAEPSEPGPERQEQEVEIDPSDVYIEEESAS